MYWFNLFFIVISVIALSADAEPLFMWSQVVANEQLSIRAVVSVEDVCPVVNVNGKDIEMGIRAVPLDQHFDDKVCELLVPQMTDSVSINNINVPIINKQIRKIAVIGDTGCRVALSSGQLIEQHCISPDEWPLEKILSYVNDHDPDLIIHVGDYLYRTAQCVNHEKCGYGVYGDNSATWRADWLEVSKLVSSKAPFLFVRGNHENCDRAHIGWFRYLDSYAYLDSEHKCEDFTNSWIFNARKLDDKNIDFYVFDSSFGNERFVSDSDVENLKKQFLPLVTNNVSNSVWFLTHRPLWSYAALSKGFYYGNLSQVKAFGELFPNNVQVILSGHVHIAQVLKLQSKKGIHIPMQIIIGNSGSLLYGVPGNKLLAKNVEVLDAIADEIKSIVHFGFAIVEVHESDHGSKVVVIFYDQFNKKVGQVDI